METLAPTTATAAAPTGFSRFTGPQLVMLLKALDCPFTNPKSKTRAIQLVWSYAEQKGVRKDAVVALADELVSGRMDKAEWRAAVADRTEQVAAQEAAGEAEADIDAAEVFGKKTKGKGGKGKKVGAAESDKPALVVALMLRPEGCTLEEMMKVTGWQRVTAMTQLSRTFKKKLGLEVVQEPRTGHDATKVYRIRRGTAEVEAPAEQATNGEAAV